MTAVVPLRVAVIGAGHWGKNLVRNFQGLGALAAVCDADPVAAARAAGEAGVPATAWPEILRDPSIPMVAIAAPAALHGSLAAEALAAGKHVFVEKPLALDVGDAERLVSIAEARGLTLMVGHLLQYHPAFLALRALAGEGKLGRLLYAYSNRLSLGRFRREENALWSFAPHDVSMILSLFGAEPEGVSASGANYLHPRIADVTLTKLDFAGGQHAHIFVSWLHPYKEQKLVLVGERGMAVFDDNEPWARKLLVYPHRVDWKDGLPVPAKADAEPIPLAEAEPLRLECQHFLDCVRTGARPRTDGAEGLRVLKVLARAQAALDRSTDQPPSTAKPKAAPASFPGVTIHESAVVDPPCTIGEGTRIWHFSHVLKGSQIGRRVSLGQNVVVGPDVTIGDGCKIQNNVSVYKGVTLEDDVFCGPSCVFTNVDNPRAAIERKDEFRATLVQRGATIGANATIVCGHRIGRYAFIGAGAVVTGEVPDYALMVGVPARRIGWMSRAGHRLGGDLVCPGTGERYRLAAPERLEPVVGEGEHV